jgi:hypothetical protein
MKRRVRHEVDLNDPPENRGDSTMSYVTSFGSLAQFEKGSIEIINDDPKHYVFSNLFEVARAAAPYDKVVVAKNLEYVIEVLRAQSVSSWFAADHDEFALVMDGEVEVELVQLGKPEAHLEPGQQGSVRLLGEPKGQLMGTIRLGRGHQALLPARAAYRFSTATQGVLLLQTLLGAHSIEKWSDICLH